MAKQGLRASRRRALLRMSVAMALTVLVIAIGLLLAQSDWRRKLTLLWNSSIPTTSGSFDTETSARSNESLDHSHEHHDDLFAAGHLGHDDDAAITFTAAGLKNIEFQAATVTLNDFERTIAVPGVVVEQTGHSQIHVTAPMAGIITRVHIMDGVAVEPGQPLFEIRLTHEELVTAQSDFLKTSQSLAVVRREIARLQSLGEGVVAGKRLIEQEYELQKLEATHRAERQALLLHGLTEQQIDDIGANNKLLDKLTVFSPEHDSEHDNCQQTHLYHVQHLSAKVGEHVDAGQLLCLLADHCELVIEGRAFEADLPVLQGVARHNRHLTAKVSVSKEQSETVRDLSILYISDTIDVATRSLHFYVTLPNTITLDRTASNGFRYLSWRFNPGQRLELQIPVETWHQRIVLPVDAVVNEGAESYVFEQNDDHFDRVAVHVEYRDQSSVVIANDGSILPGDVVAVRGAYQMYLALKNRTVTTADPHAGHTH